MELAFYADPLEKFVIKKDSTFALMKEAVKRGHRICAFCQHDLVLNGQNVHARVNGIELTGTEDHRWFDVRETEDRGLETFDAVIVRKDPPFDVEYLNSTYLLELSERKSARIFNRPDALRSHNEKLTIAQFPEFMAPTLVTADQEQLRSFHAEYRDIILKPLNAMGGNGVFRIGEDGLNLGAAIETLTASGRKAVMAQRYIPDIVEGDKRVLLINGQVVPFALARIPQKGEVRGNLAAGGTGRAQLLSERDRQIAETLAPVFADRGLFLVGLDIIGNWLTEVNVTSPTCFREIAQQTGFNVAGLFMDELEKTV
jgi:glutathione synthase